MTAPVLVVDRVTKRFAAHTAVDGLSLTVPPGSIYGLLGPNGAGKTTTIRMIMNILVPDEGQVQLFGGAGTAREYADRIGFLPEERGLYPKMKVLDVLIFLAQVRGLDRSTARGKALAWLERLGLSDWNLKKVSDLSKGMQQKVQIISTLLHDPDLILLDEPFSGLDPVNAEVILETVIDLSRRGKTILLSTHIMEQAEKICSHVGIIARGRMVVDGSLTQIKETRGGRNLVVAFDGNQGGAAQVFADRRLIAKVQDFGQYAELELAMGADAQDVLKGLVAAGARLAKFEMSAPSLHKIFVDLVGPDAGRAVAQERQVTRA
jgi:ABC-2 type transport system ATP-binding protein